MKIGRRFKKDKKRNSLKAFLIIAVAGAFFVSTAYALSNQLFTISGSAAIFDYGDCPADISYAYTITSSWGDASSGYTFQNKLSVTNNSNIDINGWTIVFKGPSDLTITTFTAESTVDQGEITISPTGSYTWAADILAGTTRDIEYQAHTAEPTLELEYLYFNSCMVITGGNDSPLRDFTLEPSQINLHINQSANITIHKMPVDARADFTYTSNNTSVATVSASGVVTGVSTGTTSIQIAANGIVKTVPVTVSKEQISLTSLSISPKSNQMKVGDEKTLTITKKPADAGDVITFTSSNPSVATVDSNGKIVALSDGTTTITASAGNLTDTATVTVIRDATKEDIEATFSHQYYDNRNIQFAINLANIGTGIIHRISFKISFPSGTTWTYWNNWPAMFSADRDGTTLTSTNSGLSLEGGSYINFTGNVTLPNGYNSSDYLSPLIYDIEVE